MAVEYSANPSSTSAAEARKTYTRFSVSQRVEHAVLLLSFTLLGITGLAQKFATTGAGEAVLLLFGGIEGSRIVHRTSAIVLMAISIYHIVASLYRTFVLHHPPSMLPSKDDISHVIQDVKYYLGFSNHKARYGRYSYAEKAEYLALVWGTVIMAITGFMMWNPIATARYLPGEAIPAAKAAHGGEALLAVLAIILWHFYHVHIRHFNKSMFTGKMTRQEMEHEHPAELEAIEAGKSGVRPPERAIRQRQQVFLPVALLLSAALGFGLYNFVTFEDTAITTVPRGENVPIFAPLTPTPTTPPPTATPLPAGAALTWESGISALFTPRCTGCHGPARSAGLSLASYAEAMEGSQNGPIINPGDPDGSKIVQVLTAGHYAPVESDELALIIKWIQEGAKEK